MVQLVALQCFLDRLHLVIFDKQELVKVILRA